MPNTPPPQVEVEIRTPLPRAVLDGLTAAGYDLAAMASEVGLQASALEGGLTAAEADRFLCAAWAKVNNPAFGLLASMHLKPERFGISGLAAMAAPTLFAAFQRKARYNRLVWGDQYDVTLDARELIVKVLSPDEMRPYGYAKIDMELASLTVFARLLTGVHVLPLWLSLRQPEPAYAALYAKTFQCPVRFAQADNRLAFSADDAVRPLRSANSAVASALTAVAESAVKPMLEPDLVARIHLYLSKVLEDGEPLLQSCAAALAMSERTLQRRLTLLGTSFAQVLDGHRHQSALEYLRQRRIDGQEMAFLLGFVDASSYFRAFRRWTQTTPEQYRLSLLHTDDASVRP